MEESGTETVPGGSSPDLSVDIENKSWEAGDKVHLQVSQLLDNAIHFHHAIAAWRQPGESEIHIVIDLSGEYPANVHPDLENMDPGFLASPYQNESNYINYFIKADIHLKGRGDGPFNVVQLNARIAANRLNRILDEAPAGKQIRPDGLQDPFDEPTGARDAGAEDKFRKIVENAREQIREGKFLKVVPSRRKTVLLPDHFSPPAMYLNMVKAYAQAFVSLFYIPEKGLWIGATPETLIRIGQNHHFYTAALAGTQSGRGIEDMSSVTWTQKEIEEQALVSRYIINCFKKIRLREFDEAGPKTIKAGNLLHLRTDFHVDMKAVNFPSLGSVMLRLLHPTSAVCGMPREPAFQFLHEQERYDREFYSGYLGPVNLDSITTLYVNLRCARIFQGMAYLYSGAGVTRDSNPEKEWNETEIKNQTIEDFIQLA